MFPINFSHTRKSHSLLAGNLYSAPRTDGFRDTPSGDLRSLVTEILEGRPWRDAVYGRYSVTNPWLYHIITDPRRISFFESVLPPGEGLVLDIGSGWGQIARPLAATRPVVALEPVAERLAFIQASAREDGINNSIAYLEADYLEIEFATRFAAICAIGVLEWVGAFQNVADPQERQKTFLCKTRRDLTENGSLILGIENRIGLKYLLGCPDDHLGVPNIACLPASLARQRWQEMKGLPLQSFTYSMSELEQMLRDAGFTRIEFFAAFPDYKLPAAIVSLRDVGRPFNHWLTQITRPDSKSGVPPEHNGYNGVPLDATMQASLAAQYGTLAAEGIAHHFVPSFFIRASG